MKQGLPVGYGCLAELRARFSAGGRERAGACGKKEGVAKPQGNEGGSFSLGCDSSCLETINGRMRGGTVALCRRRHVDLGGAFQPRHFLWERKVQRRLLGSVSENHGCRGVLKPSERLPCPWRGLPEMGRGWPVILERGP